MRFSNFTKEICLFQRIPTVEGLTREKDVIIRHNVGVILTRKAEPLFTHQQYVDLVLVVSVPHLPELVTPTFAGECDYQSDSEFMVRNRRSGKPFSCHTLYKAIMSTSQTYHQLIMELQQVHEEVQTTLHGIERTWRSKRALFGFVGSISRFLFGTAQEDDLQRLREAIESLRGGQHDTMKGLNTFRHLTVAALNQTSERIRQIGEKLEIQTDSLNAMANQMNVYMSDMRSALARSEANHYWTGYFGMVLGSFLERIAILAKLIGENRAFLQSVETLREGRVTSRLVPMTEMKQALNQVQETIKEKGLKLSVTNIEFVYHNMLHSITLGKSYLYLHFAIPTSINPSLFHVYSLQRFPIPLAPRYHTGYSIINEFDYELAVDPVNEKYIILEKADLDRCKIDHIILCPYSLPTLSFHTPSCALALYLNKGALINKLCKHKVLPYKESPTFVYPVNANSFIASHPNNTVIVSCPNATQSSESRCDTCLIELPCLCTAKIGPYEVMSTGHKCLNISISQVSHGFNLLFAQALAVSLPNMTADFSSSRPINIKLPGLDKLVNISRRTSKMSEEMSMQKYIKQIARLDDIKEVGPGTGPGMQSNWYERHLSWTTINSCLNIMCFVFCVYLYCKMPRVGITPGYGATMIMSEAPKASAAYLKDEWEITPPPRLESKVENSAFEALLKEMSLTEKMLSIFMLIVFVYLLCKLMKKIAYVLCGGFHRVLYLCPNVGRRYFNHVSTLNEMAENVQIVMKIGNAKNAVYVPVAQSFYHPNVMYVVELPRVMVERVHLMNLSADIILSMTGTFAYRVQGERQEVEVPSEFSVPVWKGKIIHTAKWEDQCLVEWYFTNAKQIWPVHTGEERIAPREAIPPVGSAPSVYTLFPGKERGVHYDKVSPPETTLK